MSIIGKIMLCISLLMSAIAPRIFMKHKQIGQPDNQIEETVEEVIKRVSGYDVDISPDTPDKSFDFEIFLQELDDSMAPKDK